ncbi:malic enzyme-like NAD(P)-binding protein [Saccharibacillus endophyticus]|uniref:Malate dehydrogenase (oxaloacetate-decarboxylating) n=1 Tax=Saccharibacillus endophyticus TaxID=2060666 RepID=A0ABQ2A2A3_9BACL|nr:malic enzyme-like NAD(P)-binding protein [Saccharibacillus endophyticus]GGH83273.1 hypothetical protein GCM10007362_35860 [Saccharibacillus endophyticus]
MVDGEIETGLCGRALLAEPMLNKGVAFTPEERKELGLEGLLPPGVLTIEEQVQRVYEQFLKQPDDLHKNIALSDLMHRNTVLFYRLLTEHPSEMLPIVYTPTVGRAIQEYSRAYHKPGGIYLSIDNIGGIEQAFRNLGLEPGDIDLIVATDSESILGIGDWGVGGINIAIGKLAVYTAAAGIDPSRVLAVVLDAGTNNGELLADPLYMGCRHERVRGRYRQCGSAMELAGLSEQEARGRFWAYDYRGLLTEETEGVLEFQRPYLRTTAECADWEREGVGKKEKESGTASVDIGVGESSAAGESAVGRIPLLEVVRRVKPTILIGTSGVAGAFTEEIVREMASHVERPVIMPMSNPTQLAEAVPADLLNWTEGRALIATGSPFEPVVHNGVMVEIGQSNNALVFPGLELGAIVTRSARITERMFAAAADAVAGLADLSRPGAALLPGVRDLRRVSQEVAIAVAEAAMEDGAARFYPEDVRAAVRDAMWDCTYKPIRLDAREGALI